jgi:homoserine dehydrogenase
MESRNCSLEKATYEAQWEKIAPGNPSFHLHGIITRNRLALQIVKIFKTLLPVNDIPTAGIENLDIEDMQIAGNFGCAIRLLGIASKVGDKIKASVEPCIIPEKYLLAQVRGGTEIIYTLNSKGDSKTFCCEGTDYETVVGGLLFDLDRMDQKVEDIVKQTEVEDFAENYYVRLNLMEINDTLSLVLKLLSQNGIEVETLMQPKKEVSRETESSGSFAFTFITSKIRRSKLIKAVEEINQNIKLATVCSFFRFIR